MLKFNKIASCLLVALLVLSFVGIIPAPTSAESTADLRVLPETVVLGSPAGESVIGQNFTIAVVIENIENLYGLDVRIAWDPTYLQYIEHTVTMPKESFPDPIPPSPYPGTLSGSLFFTKDEVDPIAGTYVLAVAQIGTTPGFNGSGTLFIMKFMVINQPYDYEISPANHLNLTIAITYYKFTDPEAAEIPLTPHDGTVMLYARKFEYPPLPLLKVTPETISGKGAGEEFTVDVWLMGEGGTDLDPFWDPGGFDIVLNFNTTLLEAVDVTIDPDGWFASFWPQNQMMIVKEEIDNTTGTVRVAFFGYGEPHTPANGKGRLFTVTFKEKLSVGATPQISLIWLYNPRWYTASYNIHSLQGLIDLTAPEGTNWITFWPYGNPMTLNTWIDQDADGKLSLGDKLYITDWEGKQLPYLMDELAGTLKVTQLEINRTDVVLAYPTNSSYARNNAVGLADYPYFGNLSLTGPNLETYWVYCEFANGTSRYLNPDEYQVWTGEDVIFINVDLSSMVYNEYYVVGVNLTSDSFAGLQNFYEYIENVHVRFPNGTERDLAYFWEYYDFPPCLNVTDPRDYAEPDYWWFFGSFLNWLYENGYIEDYYPPCVFPRGTEVWVNYSGIAWLTVFYKSVEPDPERYIEFDGTYEEFLASLTNPINTNYTEVYPMSWRSPYRVVDWFDLDTSGDLTIGDQLVLEYIDTGDIGIYEINDIATDMRIRQLGVICDKDPTHAFFGMEPDVKIAGVPHPERPMCPWHGEDSSPLLPHVTEPATFTAFFKPPGAWIDLYTQYEDPYGGQGPNEPSDMFWPQQKVELYASVTYNFWPEQNKDVTFQIIDNHGTTWAILIGRTDKDGIAHVQFRLPWTCDNPEYYLGEWTVIATVDVAGEIISDTLTFKYDYLVHIWKVITDDTSYAHEETIEITVEYGSYAMQDYNVTFTITAVDETGVPFGYAVWQLTIGGAEYCTYKNGTFTVHIKIPKFARAGVATIYVAALSDLPQNGGVAYSPIASIEVGIEAA